MKYRSKLILKKKPGAIVLILLVLSLVGAGTGIGIAQVVGEDEPRVFDESIPFKEDGQPLTPRDQLELIGMDNPGFGGYVIDVDDPSVVTVLMTNVEDRPSAERAVAAALGPQRPIGELRIAKADYAYTDLAEWYRQFRQNVVPEIRDILSVSSVRGDWNRIRIDITDIAERGRVIQALQKHGIPVNAVRIDELERFEPLSL